MTTTPYVYNATVVEVHDGDTVNVVVDRGMYDYKGSAAHPVPVRLAGCAALELSEPGGPEARDNLAALLPVGVQVVLRTVKPDKYAPRWDAYVTYTAGISGDHDLATDLIQTGWAAPWDGTGKQPKPAWPRP